MERIPTWLQGTLAFVLYLYIGFSAEPDGPLTALAAIGWWYYGWLVTYACIAMLCHRRETY